MAQLFRRAIARRRKFIFMVVAVSLVLFLMIPLFEVVSSVVSPGQLEPRLWKSVLRLWRHSLPPILADADFLIACVGDSHTEGAGAALGFDYPSQLELQLNAANPAKWYQVINLGVSGFNTSEAVDRAIEFLEKTARKPDLLIFSAGFNNAWNIEGASILPVEIRDKGNIAAWEYVLAHSRTYKLAKITGARIEALRHDRTTRPFSDEVEFLREWITYDLQRLSDAASRFGTEVVLLTYAASDELFLTWGDQTFRDFSRKNKLLLIDVNRFGFQNSEPLTAPSRWLAADWHPNRHGYARIAYLIVQALQGSASQLFDEAGAS